MNALTRCAALALAAGLAACASTSTAPVLLTLPSAVAPSSTPPAAAPASAPVLVVRRVEIPEYLVARRVRYRTDSSTLAEWPDTYWAERIEIGVSREFDAALRGQLHGMAICDTNCGDRDASQTLQVELRQLDYVRGTRNLRARARITLSSAGVAPKILRSRELTYDLKSDADTPQAQAQVMADLIRQLAAAAAELVHVSSL